MAAGSIHMYQSVLPQYVSRMKWGILIMQEIAGLQDTPSICLKKLRYYFTETNKDKVTVTEKSDYKPREVRPIGKFGRLNDMTSLKNEALAIAMKEFATEKQLAEDIFVAY